ncbi:MAG TPA: GNAT family N-acetyltransferase [Candidatus Binatia bacterium]|nr:GNAT family N-acetyltransferase [Candidatus Binatia bacterium]
MKVEVLPDFEALGPERWNSLLDRSRTASVFLTWPWQTGWIRAFAPGASLELLAASDDTGQLIGLLPLHETAGVRRLIGGADVSDYLDLIAVAGSEGEVWEALLEHRAASPAPWELRGIRAASPTLEILARLGRERGLEPRTEREERCPVLALPGSWPAYLQGLDGKDRHELRRKIRRLERELPGSRVWSESQAAGWDTALSRFLALHRLSKVGKARFMDDRMEGFFRAVTADLAREGWARLWFLEGPQGPVASFLCVEYAGAVGLYNSGFDPAHARLAPGIVLLAHVIRDAIDREIAVFDFLRGEEPYKYSFGPAATDLYAIRLEG